MQTWINDLKVGEKVIIKMMATTPVICRIVKNTDEYIEVDNEHFNKISKINKVYLDFTIPSLCKWSEEEEAFIMKNRLINVIKQADLTQVASTSLIKIITILHEENNND